DGTGSAARDPGQHLRTDESGLHPGARAERSLVRKRAAAGIIPTAARTRGRCRSRIYSKAPSTTAKLPVFCTKSTRASPSVLRSLSAATLRIGPGDSALPGSGWGNAVDRAVWNVTF